MHTKISTEQWYNIEMLGAMNNRNLALVSFVIFLLQKATRGIANSLRHRNTGLDTVLFVRFFKSWVSCEKSVLLLQNMHSGLFLFHKVSNFAFPPPPRVGEVDYTYIHVFSATASDSAWRPCEECWQPPWGQGRSQIKKGWRERFCWLKFHFIYCITIMQSLISWDFSHFMEG